jgi:hypothetical protein
LATEPAFARGESQIPLDRDRNLIHNPSRALSPFFSCDAEAGILVFDITKASQWISERAVGAAVISNLDGRWSARKWNGCRFLSATLPITRRVVLNDTVRFVKFTCVRDSGDPIVISEGIPLNILPFV